MRSGEHAANKTMMWEGAPWRSCDKNRVREGRQGQILHGSLEFRFLCEYEGEPWIDLKAESLRV